MFAVVDLSFIISNVTVYYFAAQLYVFTAQSYASVVYAVVVCLSIHLSQASVVQKWLKMGLRKQCYMIVHGFKFSDSKDRGKFQWHSQQGRQMQVGRLKLAIFN